MHIHTHLKRHSATGVFLSEYVNAIDNQKWTGLFKNGYKPNDYKYDLDYKNDIIYDFRKVEVIGKQILFQTVEDSTVYGSFYESIRKTKGLRIL